MINTSLPIKMIMTEQVKTVKENCIMTEVAELFDTNEFHHMPVTNNANEVTGIISKSDYYKLQDNMTLFGVGRSDVKNEKLFGSLIASDVMKEPLTVKEDLTIMDAIELFLANTIHSLIVTSNKKCVGIITPHDILRKIATETKLLGSNK